MPRSKARLRRIAKEGARALIYLHQTSQGFSMEKVGDRNALSFHRGRTLPSLLRQRKAECKREIGIGAQILSDLNLRTHPVADEPTEESSGAGGIWD